MWIHNCERNGWIFCIWCMICNDLKFQRLKYFLKFQSNKKFDWRDVDYGYLNNCMTKTYKIERDK